MSAVPDPILQYKLASTAAEGQLSMLNTETTRLALATESYRGGSGRLKTLCGNYVIDRIDFMLCHEEYGTLALAGPGMRIA